MSELKMGILSVALVGGAAIYALATVMGRDLSIADMATQLVQHGTYLLHRLLL
ncbi:hypothetical protein [Cupriavidus necator]|uniref:hypothetical protein n=1 Tax=Cupriavidus necator TaxID=106590 RepID=UPI0013DED16E|nr:hypothetical protein [Cupriavidus necator]